MTYGRMTDAMLMEQTAQNDRTSFAQLIRRHATGLLNFIDRMVGDPHRSEDIFQEVVLAVWIHRRQYQASRPVQPWLYKIALNRCRREFRSRVVPPLPLSDDPPVASREPDPALEAERRETAELVQAAVDRLPDLQRAVVSLRIYQGMSYGEIAQVLDRTEGTVRSYMHHAVQALRRYL